MYRITFMNTMSGNGNHNKPVLNNMGLVNRGNKTIQTQPLDYVISYMKPRCGSD